MAAEKTPEEIKNLQVQLRQWIEEQPHIPHDLDERLLKRFLHSCYYDMAAAKSTAELFFTIRNSCPEVLNDRDPLSANVTKTLTYTKLGKHRISGNRNLWVWQLNDPGLENFDYISDVRLFFLSTDAWLLADDFFQEGDIAVLDVKDISLKFITKLNMSVARKLAKYQEDALPIRLQQIHIVNSPAVIDKIYAVIKPFLKQDMTDMLHFHAPNLDTLYKFLKKEDLPVEFGGTNGSIDEYMKDLLSQMHSLRDILSRNDLWRVEKKSKNKASADISTGSFRALAID